MPAKINTVRPYKNGKTPKVKTLVEANFREMLANSMSINFPDIITAQVSLAKGFQHTKEMPDGTLINKTELPDVQAAKLLFEYTMEKPKQTIEHKGTVGIVALVAQLENGDNDEDS
jgi:hypothetical protein